LGGTFSGSSLSIQGEDVDVVESNRIPEDIDKLFKFWSLKISPNNEKRGRYFLWIFIILFIFWNEIFRTIKKIKLKKQW